MFTLIAERVEMIMPLSTLGQQRGEERRGLIWDDNDDDNYSSLVVLIKNHNLYDLLLSK